jgi:hypothetical protein
MVGERLIGEWSGARDQRRETKILLEGEWGFEYFDPCEMSFSRLTGYNQDLSEGRLWQGMRWISIWVK